MSASLPIEQFKTENKSSRNGYIPDLIVCHQQEEFDGEVFPPIGQPVSSAHFKVFKDGAVSQYVDIGEAAWTQGLYPWQTRISHLDAVRERETNPNNYCISVEFEGRPCENGGRITPEQVEKGAELIAHILCEVYARYGVRIPADREHIVGHFEINPVYKPNCPGKEFPFEEILQRLQKQDPCALYAVEIGAFLSEGQARALQKQALGHGFENAQIRRRDV